MVTSMQCDAVSQIKDYIQKYPNEDFKIDMCYMQQVCIGNLKKLVLNEDCILSKYRNELATEMTHRDLSTTEYRKYRYNPKVFSYDVYGTTELWFLILYANEMYSVTQFDVHRVYYYEPYVFLKLTHIIDKEKQFTDINRESVSTELRKPISAEI